MIRSILQIDVPAATAPDVLARYAELEVLENSIRLAGALSCEILQNMERDGSIVVLALWAQEADYIGWRAHPERERITQQLADLLELTQATAYEVRASFSAPLDAP